MRYSFWQSFDKNANLFKLYLQLPEEPFVRCYEFFSKVEGISDIPGITRLFGEEIHDPAGHYFLYPINYDHVEAGFCGLLQKEEKFLRIEFFNDENESPLKGKWVLRKLSNGMILFWKPPPVIYTMPTKNVEVKVEEGDKTMEIEQKFSVFQLESSDGKFTGIAAAEGVWTGQDLHTTLFSDKDIENIYEQMKDKLPEMLVDYNHDFVNNGGLKKIALKTQRGVKYIEVEGEGNSPIPLGSGLSLIIKSKLKWDTNLNVWTLAAVVPKGVSILTQGNPACTICMVR